MVSHDGKEKEQALQTIDDLLARENKPLFSTIGVYPSGDRKYNGVLRKDLKRHVGYNLTNRPGRSFFVEGHCLNRGYLDKNTVSLLEKEFAEKPHIPKRATVPYQ